MTEEPDQIPTDYTVGEAWLVYRPVMDYEESETPYCICLTEGLAEETRKELVRFAESILPMLPRYPTTCRNHAADQVLPFAKTEEKREKAWFRASNKRHDILKRVAWPLGIDLHSDFRTSDDIVTFDASSIAVRKLPLVQPR